jgi:hypothetical protein
MRHLKPAHKFRASVISLVTSRTLKTLSMIRAFEGPSLDLDFVTYRDKALASD